MQTPKKLVKVCNHGPSPLVLRGARGQIHIELGACHVDADLLSAILAEDTAKKGARALFEKQCTVHPEQVEGRLEEAPPGPIVPIHKLSKKAALALIDKCNSAETLKFWSNQDAREDIQKALHLQWRRIAPAGSADAPDITVA